jgi:hypothetical protein
MQFRFGTQADIVKKILAQLGKTYEGFIVESLMEDLSVEQVAHDFRCYGHPTTRTQHWVDMFKNHSYSGSDGQIFCVQVLLDLDTQRICQLIHRDQHFVKQCLEKDLSGKVEDVIRGFKNCGHPSMHMQYWVNTFHKHSPPLSEAQAFCVQVLAGLEDNLAHHPYVPRLLLE